MIKKIFIILTVFFFLNGCGFTPIFNSKNINIKIDKIDYDNNKINRNFAKSISNLSNQASDNFYNLNISSFSEKNIVAKDPKGNPSVYNLRLKVDITLINNNDKKVIKESFSENINLNSTDDKFELKNTENILLDQMSQKILQDILKFLASVK